MNNKRTVKNVSQKTKQKKDMVHGQIVKQLNNLSSICNKGEYHYRLKMLELNNIKTVEANKISL